MGLKCHIEQMLRKKRTPKFMKLLVTKSSIYKYLDYFLFPEDPKPLDPLILLGNSSTIDILIGFLSGAQI